MKTYFKNFHQASINWFTKRFDSASEIQEKAWPLIKAHQHTLIAAPTGSGKTLAAFYASIDSLVQKGLNGTLKQETEVLYVSPLKALSNDIEKNLRLPIQGIKDELKQLGLAEIQIKAAVRTGDTSQSDRTAMIKSPPHIIVSTPESLYLLLTSENGRKMLSTVNTIIVDEIHALVGNKRGSHLSLSLERLEHICQNKPVRIGLSATQKPIETVKNFLIGNRPDIDCKIIDSGHKRHLDLAIDLPDSPMTAVMANEVWDEIFDKLQNYIENHHTTLIFVNTRRLAERLAHTMSAKLGKGTVTAHHGSMSKEHRLEAEQNLKSGKLKALIATASLELGIDIGSVDLVCQIGSPRSIAAFLQRVGRSGHSVGLTPKGRLFPLTMDELVECAALFDAIRRGELDMIEMPEKPLDILAQHIVAEVANEEHDESTLFKLITSAWPYRDLTKTEFDETIKMLSEGFTTRRGRRAAYIHHDLVHEKLRARKGARLTALVSGGAIPDNFDYDIILEPAGTYIGTLNEDFAIESMPGDIFQLANTSWQILKIENGKVRVMDAEGQPPTLPFWLGEAPGRSHELSYSVSRLRETVSERLGELNDLPDNSSLDHSWKQAAIDWLTGELELNESAADQIATYLGVSKAALGEMPSQNTLVLERFFDEAGDMHLVIHSPFGNRLNRAWGLALRKRFCRNFNFELQAAANDNTIILSLGATHSFPLDEVFNYLHPNTVRQILIQAVLDSPIFEVRWRWNASRALAVLRRRAGKKVPAQIQRIQTEDLISLVFPDQLACFENIAGDREIPDHPLVNQTIHDCLYEAMDIELLERILADIHAGNKTLIAKDLREASPLAHEILNARPYAFLDDAPLEERRTRAVMNRRWLDPKEASELGQLDQAAIDAVRAEVWPDVQTGDELLDALVLFGFLTEDEGKRGNSLTDWSSLFAELLESKRATKLITDKQQFWIAVERLPEMQAVFPNAKMSPEMPIPDRIEERAKSIDQPLKELIRNRLEASGPIQSGQIADLMGLSDHQVESQLVALENEGFVFRGHFTPGQDELEWCERRLLARIHRYTLKRLRSEVQPVSAQDFMRFLFDWQYLTQRGEGPEFLKTVLEQLEGYEAAAASWESELLPARMKFYDHQILDSVCLSGTVVWGRFRRDLNNGSKKASPIKTTPISFVQRSNLNHWKELTAFEQTIELSSYAEQVYQTLAQNGASFFDEIVDRSRLLRTQVEEAMNELVANGLISADSFTGLRSLLIPANKKVRSNYRMRKRSQIFDSSQAGRWWILKRNEAVAEENQFSIEQIELFARQLLRRYGVVFRKLVYQEKAAPPWRDLVRVLRRMEARGEIRGGRFVDAVWGEQFALEEAVTQLRKTRKAEKDGQLVTISAADPLNLVGIITPEQRIPAFYKNRILYKDGETIAVRNKNDVVFLKAIPDAEKWNYQKTLIYRNANPRLNVYLGKEKIPVPGSN